MRYVNIISMILANNKISKSAIIFMYIKLIIKLYCISIKLIKCLLLDKTYGTGLI